ncbi:MAG: glycoside hydrolase family 16 protein [Bacteroidales bacterium]|nr:glycoside hydrolase family 16 protein [Bacteroidales bacterium]
MKRLSAIIALLIPALVWAQDPDTRFMGAFKEDFDGSKPQYFSGGSAPRLFFGVPSLSEKGSTVMLERIQPSDPAGAGRGPEISSNKRTHFGTYSARLRVPDVKKAQANVGAVVGYFTYRFTQGFGLSEIDFEWLIADPRLIYIGTWTSAPDNVNNLQRVGRTINLTEGKILYTNYRSYHDGNLNHNFDSSDDAALTPRTIQAIPDYDASKKFYVYGFDWYPDRLTWWIQHPDSGDKIILWDYRGTTPNFSGIPQPPTTYMLNFWHTKDWSVDTNPRSKEAPKYPYCLEVDWMKYEPYDDLNIKWREENGF